MVAFQDVKYETNEGDISIMRLLPSRAAVAGTQPADASNTSLRVKISKSDREFGVRPRGVRLSRIVGTAPDTFRRYSFLPVTTPTAFATAAFQLGATIAIDGTDWTVSARIEEDY